MGFGMFREVLDTKVELGKELSNRVLDIETLFWKLFVETVGEDIGLGDELGVKKPIESRFKREEGVVIERGRAPGDRDWGGAVLRVGLKLTGWI